MSLDFQMLLPPIVACVYLPLLAEQRDGEEEPKCTPIGGSQPPHYTPNPNTQPPTIAPTKERGESAPVVRAAAPGLLREDYPVANGLFLRPGNQSQGQFSPLRRTKIKLRTQCPASQDRKRGKNLWTPVGIASTTQAYSYANFAVSVSTVAVLTGGAVVHENHILGNTDWSGYWVKERFQDEREGGESSELRKEGRITDVCKIWCEWTESVARSSELSASKALTENKCHKIITETKNKIVDEEETEDDKDAVEGK
ncbi:hypothetical protein F2P81_011509 [Scomber scombrus]|uniref:Uncharacterized protein n=1 Tax=Scomber scombrus TaxID=13677 RepID=A0AAV1NCS3_SCOSC